MDISIVMNFLLIAGAIHGFIFNVATFLSRREIEKPVVFLNLFVFFLSMNNLQSWLIDKGYVSNVLFLENFVFPWYVMIVPMFYAFLIHYLGLQKVRKTFLGLSIFVFVGEFVGQSLFLIMVDQGYFDPGSIPLYNAIEDAVTLFYSLLIFTKVILLIYKYPQLNPSILEIDDLKWIKRFVAWGGLIFVLWGVAVFLNIFSATIKAPHSYYPLRIASSVLIYWTGYQAFFRYAILKDQIVLRKKMQDDEAQRLGGTKSREDKKTAKVTTGFS